MTSLSRLWTYARRYRPRLAAALVAMAVYGAGTAGVATLIRPIFDEVLPTQRNLLSITLAIVGAYGLKGLGAYLSSYLMADVGQRVVHDRNELFRHMLGQSAAFFSPDDRPPDVADHQRRRCAAARRVGDRSAISPVRGCPSCFSPRSRVLTRGSPSCASPARRSCSYPLVQFGRRVRRTSRRSQEALEHMSHVSAEAFTGHRIVTFGMAQEAVKFRDASHRFYRTSMRVTSVLSLLPPLMELVGGVAFVLALWPGSRRSPRDG